MHSHMKSLACTGAPLAQSLGDFPQQFIKRPGGSCPYVWAVLGIVAIADRSERIALVAMGARHTRTESGSPAGPHEWVIAQAGKMGDVRRSVASRRVTRGYYQNVHLRQIIRDHRARAAQRSPTLVRLPRSTVVNEYSWSSGDRCQVGEQACFVVHRVGSLCE